MHMQLPVFDLHLQRIEEKLLKRLPEADRKARELQRLFRVIEAQTGLASFFSSELHNVLYLLNVGSANEDDAGLEDGTPAETRIAAVQCALDELLVFCAYVKHPIPQMSDACQESAGAPHEVVDRAAKYEEDVAEPLASKNYPAPGTQEHKQPARAVDGALAKKYDNVVVEYRRIQQSLARAGLNKQMIKDMVLRKACQDISTSFDKFKAACMGLIQTTVVFRAKHTVDGLVYE
jgi:hypothetical protein